MANHDEQTIEPREGESIPPPGAADEGNVYPREQRDKMHAIAPSPPGITDLIFGILFAPGRTFELAVRQLPLFTAAALYITLHFLDGLAGLWTAPLLWEGLTALPPGLSGAQLPPSLLPILFWGGLVWALLKWYLFSGLLHLTAELKGGSGRAKGVLAVYGLSALPLVLLLPVKIVVLLLFPAPWRPILVGLLGAGFWGWQLALLAQGIGREHRISTGQAFGIMLKLLSILLFVLLVLLMLAVALITVILASPGGGY